MNEGETHPRNIIDDVIFDGPIHLPPAAVDELVTSIKQRESSASIDLLLEETEEVAIRGAWQDNGYFKVEVSGRALPLGGDATSQHFSFIFHVDEGLQYRVGDIRFTKTPDSAYTAVYSSGSGSSQTKPSNDGESGSAYTADSTHTEDSSSKPTLRKRNPSSRVASDLTDPADAPIFSVEELRKLLPLQEGDILSVQKVREGLAAMKKLYGSQGYIDFTATPFTDVDDEHQLVSLRIELDEQKQYRIGKIEVLGLDDNSKNALIWKIKLGDVFNTDLFEAFFKDNQSVLPLGASDQNSEVRRNTKDGIAYMKFVFHPCPRQ
jgi:hypothetical protein